MAPSLSRGIPFVYILRLRSRKLYVGCSADYEARFKDHASGAACRTTRLDPPTALLWIELHQSFSSARRREAQLKKWSRAKKQALMEGRFEQLKMLSQSKTREDKSGSPSHAVTPTSH